MEKLDKNYVIGFILLFVMYGTYMFLNPAVPSENKEKTTTESAKKQAAKASVRPDSLAIAAKFGDFSSAVTGQNNDVVLENEDLKITLSSKGGALKRVELKNYKTYEDFVKGKSTPMLILDEENSKIDLELATTKGKINLADLHFEVEKSSAREVLFVLSLEGVKRIEQKYSLPETGFAIDYDLNFEGTESLVLKQPISLKWENKLKQLENDLVENRKMTQVNIYKADGDFDDFGQGSLGETKESVEGEVSWFSFKQKYFTSAFVSEKQPLTKLDIEMTTPAEADSLIVKDATVSALVPVQAANHFKYYFGPNEMKTLKPVAKGFHQNLYLGYDLVKPINRFVFVPLFNWLEQFITNYGLLIIVVVLIIKLVLTPLLYKSYVSSAKMRILSPEIAAIKERVGDDQIKVQQETMNLYKQVGVSPLSGCVPMLLQMPVLLSVFFLFPNMEMFRQKNFLWASDLSTYDAPLQWSANLPVIGTHLSLFVVLMTLSSLAFTYYNNQVTPDQPGPIDMKKMSYIFPVVFLFVLNSYPAALSFYYLVSNLVTIGQQLLVKRFVNEDKIREILEDNKRNFATKPKKKNKFSDYLEKQLQTQEELNKKKAKELQSRKK